MADDPSPQTAETDKDRLPGPWKRGLPRGPFTEQMLRDFEVYFTIGGVKWHRRRSKEDRAALDKETARG